MYAIAMNKNIHRLVMLYDFFKEFTRLFMEKKNDFGNNRYTIAWHSIQEAAAKVKWCEPMRYTLPSTPTGHPYGI